MIFLFGLAYFVFLIFKSDIIALESVNDILNGFNQVVVYSRTPAFEFLFAVAVLVDDLHLFHNGRFARFPAA